MTDKGATRRSAVELTKLRRARYRKAAELRESGKTFREIGEALGVKGGWARQMALSGLKLRERGTGEPNSLAALTASARSALWHHDCHTRKDAEATFRNGVRVGSVPGLGIATALEIARWLGVSVIEKDTPSARGAQPGGVLPPGAGARLREERERLGMSQGDLATALGMATKTVYNLEQQATSMTLAFLDELARVGADVEYVIFARRRLP